MVYYGQELYHWGIKGQKWGLRRWQNSDGSLTPAGREHYGYGEAKSRLKEAKEEYKKAKSDYKNSEDYQKDKEKLIKAAKIGAAVAATALVAYGGYKLYQHKDEISTFIKQGKSNISKLINPINEGISEYGTRKDGNTEVSSYLDKGFFKTKVTTLYDGSGDITGKRPLGTIKTNLITKNDTSKHVDNVTMLSNLKNAEKRKSVLNDNKDLNNQLLARLSNQAYSIEKSINDDLRKKGLSYKETKDYIDQHNNLIETQKLIRELLNKNI